jgi:hypothetical protein
MYNFNNVEDGTYKIKITDDNECVIIKSGITVNCSGDTGVTSGTTLYLGFAEYDLAPDVDDNNVSGTTKFNYAYGGVSFTMRLWFSTDEIYVTGTTTGGSGPLLPINNSFEIIFSGTTGGTIPNGAVKQSIDDVNFSILSTSNLNLPSGLTWSGVTGLTATTLANTNQAELELNISIPITVTGSGATFDFILEIVNPNTIIPLADLPLKTDVPIDWGIEVSTNTNVVGSWRFYRPPLILVP